MKRCARFLLPLVLVLMTVASPAAAGSRIIVRVTGGLPVLQTLCALLGCSVKYGLGDPAGQVFLITSPDLGNVTTFLSRLTSQIGVTNAELDVVGGLSGTSGSAVPPALSNRTPVNYYGTTVWGGYVNQPATQIVGLARTQSEFGVSGRGAIVAVIDTGVDTSHAVLAPALVPGYDFTRNKNSADEKGDLKQSTVAVV